MIGGLTGLDPYQDGPACQVGLALSGGGARGISTIGILQAFEENNIEIAAIAGTSMGGVIGGLYAAGYTPAELTEIVRELNIADLISNRAPRSSLFLEQRQERDRYLLTVRFDGWRPQIPQALTGGQEITSLLTRLTTRANYLAGGDFTRFPIPFKTVGTDVVSGDLVVMSSGSLADAMRATMAFPLAFTGVSLGDNLLMDGGMLMPVPVEIVREMVDESTPVVAVNTTSPLVGREGLVTPFDIANQVTTIMTTDALQLQLALADHVITPLKDELTSVDFALSDSLIFLGYQAGLIAADSICAQVVRELADTVYQVGRFEIICSDSVLVARLRQAGLDQPFTLAQLVADLKTLVRTEPIYDITCEIDFHTVPAVDSNPEPTVDVRLIVRIQPIVAETIFRFEGNTVYDDMKLADQCEFPNLTLSPVDLVRSADRIVNLYAVDGYDMADIKGIEVDLERGEVLFRIDEAMVRRIDVANNKRSRDWLVRSYFPVKRLEPFSLKKASRGLSDLYGTELFERATFDLRPVDSGAVMTLRVRERKYSQMRFGWHWHDEYESEEFVEFLDDNINGIGLEFLTHIQYGTDRERYYTGLRLDRIFSTYLSARLRFFYLSRDRNLFDAAGRTDGYRDEDRWGMSFYLGQQIARLGQVRLGLVVEEVTLKDHRDRTSSKFGLRTLHFESRVETFDRYPFPNRGNKQSFEIRFAGKLLGGEIEYTRFLTSLESYHPLGEYLNYHPRLLVGISRRGLPASEKFYLGGMHSFGGYRTDELSGDKAFVFSQELRLKLPYRFFVTGRVDFGDVYASAEDIKPGEFKHGLGLSLAFDSPIGPFELGWGGGFSKKDRVYFSAGFEF